MTVSQSVEAWNTDFQYQSSFTPNHIKYLKNETSKLFDHAWSSYMKYGFPADEVRPITCEPYGPDYEHPENVVRNDAMGNVSLTLLDNVDTLIIMEKWDELDFALKYLKSEENTLFDTDTIVQVFEFTIRSLGGLLSTHLLLTDVATNVNLPGKYDRLREAAKNYDGFLLNMAHSLGRKLLPAFQISTNIPVPRINLAKGIHNVPAKFQKENCLSGATTPVLEFTLLSRLTGDSQFEYYTQLTFWKLWSSKLPLNLLPMTIDPISNKWLDSVSGIGASVDSFYEYSAKASIIFDDDYMWNVFKTSYKALLIHLAQGGGPFDGSMIFSNVNTMSGTVESTWIDSLGAFWSGLQVLTGQLNDAVKTHLVYLKIWDHFDLIPERWNFISGANLLPSNKLKVENAVPLEWYPLRPEFIESTYYLYRATKDPMYLHIGERILKLFLTRYKATCGINGVQDIRTGKRQNRMETFAMSETLKYLYLLFDVNDEIFLHDNDVMGNKNWVFSTEAHPLWFNKIMEPKNLNISTPSNESVDGSALNLEADVKPLLLVSLFSRISKNPQNKVIENIEKEKFFRNITLPEVDHYELPGIKEMNHISLNDDFDSKFDKCERMPDFMNRENRSNSHDFMISNYYTWSRFFDANYAFQNTLVRPKYLDYYGEYNQIEVSPSFYEKFTMFPKQNNSELYLQCPRSQTTKKHELFLGDRNGITSVQISSIKVNPKVEPRNSLDYKVLNNDLWVPILNSLRLSIETLKPGLIDSQNNFITEEYILSRRPDDFDAAFGVCNKNDSTKRSVKDIHQVLRINRINGVNVEQGLVIWTSPFEIPETNSDLEPPLLDVGSDGRVKLQGNVVENLVVWFGED